MESIQAIKQRFGIIGNDVQLNRAIEKAMRVAPTDISVLVTGESGVGKENIPKIIHSLSHRKHAKYNNFKGLMRQLKGLGKAGTGLIGLRQRQGRAARADLEGCGGGGKLFYHTPC